MAGQWTLSFGQTLRYIRLARGLTIEEVATKSGRNPGYLSTIERDKAIPSAGFLRDIAPFYGCPWWSDVHNVTWLHMVAALGGDSEKTTLALSPGNRNYFNLASATVEVVAQAITEDSDARQLYRQCLEMLSLPGMGQLDPLETVPVWAWILETLEINQSEMWMDPPDGVGSAQRLLTWINAFFRKNAVNIDRAAVAQAVQAFREARQWTSADLARAASQQLHTTGEAGLQTKDIEAIEQGSGEVDIQRLSAIAQAFEVPLSQLLHRPAVKPQVTEAEIVQLLRQYGLNDRAITVIKAMLSYIKGQPEEPTDPIP